MAIRSISDSVAMRVPRRVITSVDPVGRLSFRALFSDIIFNPKDWPDIVRLGMGMRAACSTLDNLRKSFLEDHCGFIIDPRYD